LNRTNDPKPVLKLEEQKKEKKQTNTLAREAATSSGVGSKTANVQYFIFLLFS